MPITCQICNRKFEKQITNKHLKTHNISTVDYKHQFGRESLSSPEYKAQLSASRSGENNPMFGKTHTEESIAKSKARLSGRPAHNKNKPMDESQKQILRELTIARNAEWHEQGNHPLVGRVVSQDTRNKTSKSVIEYAKANPEEMALRAEKAIQTKRDNGYDFAFFKGRTHTEESIQKGLKTTKASRDARRLATHNRNVEIINSFGYQILDFDSDYWFYTLYCSACGKTFSTTIQNFHPAKQPTYQCQLCPSDVTGKSKAELELLSYISSLVGKSSVVSGDRSIIAPKELDILVPEKHLAIEYCGLNCHGEKPVDARFSSQGKNSKYHIGKMEACEAKGYDLITVFSDEWCDNPEIVKSIIQTKLGKNINRIFARKCDVRGIDAKQANAFLNENHIQGAGRSQVRYGLFYANSLVSVMTFMKGDTSHKGSEWEINRFASSLSTTVVGGASKLFKKFIEQYIPSKVVSFADRRYGKGSVYGTLGFTLVDSGSPGYWYIKGNTRFHRYKFAKHTLIKEGFDASKTEWEIMQERGYDRIWDCGHSKWIWTK